MIYHKIPLLIKSHIRVKQCENVGLAFFNQFFHLPAGQSLCFLAE